jgi:hypothetical protein
VDREGALEAEASSAQPAGRRISFAEALRLWTKIGWLSFGGPAGQIALMHRELVERHRWISEARFLHGAFVAILKYKVGMGWTLGVSAVLGAIYWWLRHGFV